jgi:hypothetical protein
VVDRTALEMRHTGNRIGGSNPSLSASPPTHHPSLMTLARLRRAVETLFAEPTPRPPQDAAVLSAERDAYPYQRDVAIGGEKRLQAVA